MCDVYKEFNHALKTLLRELIAAYPMVKELKPMLLLYKVMKTVNRKMPQKYFHQLIAEHHYNNIISKNYDFFISDDFNDKEVSYIMSPLKNIFKTLTEDERTIIWEHMILLLSCNNKCIKI